MKSGSMSVRCGIMLMKENDRYHLRLVTFLSRSPLNVVRAGLDVLRNELNLTAGVEPSTLELLDDIISSSDTSINFLNELLDYEHMDAGKHCIEQFRGDI